MKNVVILAIVILIIAVIGIIFVPWPPRPNEVWIIEEDLSPDFTGNAQALDNQQLRNMAGRIAMVFDQMPLRQGKGKILVSQAKIEKSKLKTFGGFLKQKLPKTWTVIRGGNPDLIVAGYFFHPKNQAKQVSALFLFLVEPNTGTVLSAATNCEDANLTTACETLIAKIQESQKTNLTVEVISKSQDSKRLHKALVLEKMVNAKLGWMNFLANDIRRESEKNLRDKLKPSKPERIGANLSVTGTVDRITLELSKLEPDYELLAISTDESNEELTSSCENLILDLLESQDKTTISSLKIAVVNARPSTDDSIASLVLEKIHSAKINNAKMANITVLSTSYTEKYGTQLRKAWHNGDELTENAREALKGDSGRRLAVLSIEQEEDSFFLELTGLPDRDLLATSAPRPLAIHIDSRPEQARILMITPNGMEKKLGFTPKSLSQKHIERFKVKNGTKFILTRPDKSSRTYSHPGDAKREIEGDTIYYTYKWYGLD